MWSNMILQTFRFDLSHKMIINSDEFRCAVCELPQNQYTNGTNDSFSINSQHYELMKKEKEMTYEEFVAAVGMSSGDHPEFETKISWLGGHQGVIQGQKNGSFFYCLNKVYVVANFVVSASTPTTGITQYLFECTDISLTGFVSLPATLNFYINNSIMATMNAGVYRRSGNPLFSFTQNNSIKCKPGISVSYNGITLSDKDKTIAFSLGDHAYVFVLSNT